MRVLGIETSCDETSVAVVEGRDIISNVIASQVDIHRQWGGIVPEVAARKHVEVITALLLSALEPLPGGLDAVDGVAVTRGPGLIGALLVGLGAAKALAAAGNLPLIGINHLEGHVMAVPLAHEDARFPAVALVVSGGHTMLVHVKAPGDFRILGSTRDDAAGEAFDKIARRLGLGYPGGPIIDQLAKQGGDPDRIPFPRAMMESGNLEFSFSGLKTAVINFSGTVEFQKVSTRDLAASFQEAVVDALVEKSMRACFKMRAERLLVCGGVACNSRLRERMRETCLKKGIQLFIPPPKLCADNAAMTAYAGLIRLERGESSPLTIEADPNIGLG